MNFPIFSMRSRPLEADASRWRSAAVIRIPLLCALFSGGAGLLYQVIWNRELLLLFGSTSAAAAAVVAAFMAGMSLGAWGVARFPIVHRQWAIGLYAILELGVAGYALLFPSLLSTLQALYPGLWHAAFGQPALLNLLRLGLGLAILAPPTLMMGATLPLLVAALHGTLRLASKSVGWIYGLNAGGGALGAALTGLLLLPVWGLTYTRFVGVGLSTVAAALALLLARHQRTKTDPQALAVPAEASGTVPRWGHDLWSRRVLLAGLVGTGFASMAYEVLWTRMLVLITGSSTYAFSLMLALYVAGLAIGSLWVAAKVARLRAPGDVFAHLQIGAAGLVIAGLWLFSRYPDWQLSLYQTWGTTFGVGLGVDALLAALLIVPPTILLGAAFPVATEALGSSGNRASATSTVLATMAFGNAAGAVAAGSGLVPWLGMEGGLVALAGLTWLCGFIVSLTRFGSTGGRRIGAAAGIVLVGLGSVLVPRWDPLLLTSGVYERAPVYLNLLGGSVQLGHLLKTYQLLDYQEGNQASVSVIRIPTLQARPHLALSIDGKVDASTGKDMSTQIMSGHIGMLLRPEARTALVVGLASGVTLGSVEQWPSIKHVVIAEISPSVVHAERWFGPFNHDALQDPRARLVIDDGRHYLTVIHRQFQLVVSEPSNPWESGPARLFTREFFQQVQHHLTPNGVYVQWVPLYGLSTELLKTEVRTFLSVFPHVVMLRVSKGDLVLVGGHRKLVPQDHSPLPPTVATDLERVDSDRWRLLARFVAGDEGLRQWAGKGALNTDNNGLLEFGAPRYLLAPTLEANVKSLGQIPWRADLARWGAHAPLSLARAFLRRGEIQRAAFLAQRVPSGPAQSTLNGDIAARRSNWVTAADWWQRAGTASAQLSLAELAFSDGQAQRAAAALADVKLEARTPYFHYLSMLIALQRGDIDKASTEASQLVVVNADTGWQILAAYFKDLIQRRLGHAVPEAATATSTFDRQLDRLRQHLEREQSEPVLDELLRRRRDLPPGFLDAGNEKILEQAMSTRLLDPLEIYNRGVSLFFMGRFEQAEHVLQDYLRVLPADSGPSYARVLIERARLLRGAVNKVSAPTASKR